MTRLAATRIKEKKRNVAEYVVGLDEAISVLGGQKGVYILHGNKKT